MRYVKRLWTALLIMALLAGVCIPAQASSYNNPYYIEVDITNQIVTVYNTADGSVARQMICSTGVRNSTPKGTFYLPKIWNRGYERTDRQEWYWFDVYKCYAKWPTRIQSDILFHSLIFDDKQHINKKSIDALGSKASHGCIRLRIEDAEFIAKNCFSGTRVVIHESGELNETLRMRLKFASYTGEDGLSYEDFCAISENGLGLGDTGERVSDLQSRLQDLGYYKGSINGEYDMTTVTSVRRLQNDLGVHPSGTVEQELEQIIFSSDAPLSSEMVDLTEGRSGPAVRKFQTALAQLGFYDDDIDGVYDLGVIQAVKNLQQTCGYEPDGVASTEIQHLVYFELDKIKKALGSEEFQVEKITEDVTMGTIVSKLRVNVRQKASAESNQLGQLTPGTEVMTFGTKNDWTKIYVYGTVGYVLTNTLKKSSGTNTYLRYSANGESVTIGGSYAEYEAGTAISAAQELRAYIKEHPDMDYLGEEEEYVTVDTGDDNVTLNLRSDASSDSEILAQLPNGTSLRMLSRGAEWTSVSYEDQIGFLMSQYLVFQDGEMGSELQAVDAYDDEEEIVIVAASDGSGTVNLYTEADETSAVVKALDNNTQLSLISISEDTGWALVSDGNVEGYIQGVDLSFSSGLI